MPVAKLLQSDISYIGKLIPFSLYAQFPCETERPTSPVEFNGLTASGPDTGCIGRSSAVCRW